ncbi:MAG: Fe-S protein assembly co-chaperone HscB [Cocleimonas sp.]|nr:Fe-S protein assembly co-chaperone HscB [Cocleimonas sp.]
MMSLNFTQNYFELFSLSAQFSLDRSLLARNFRELQAKYHPDRFVNESDQERRVAVQTTGYINEANEALKSPRLRAQYLLELKDVDFELCDSTHDMPFLMAQMETREALEAAIEANDALDQVDKIGQQVKQDKQALEDNFQQNLEADQLELAKDAVLKMKFYERLSDEVKRLQEKLEDEMFA